MLERQTIVEAIIHPRLAIRRQPINRLVLQPHDERQGNIEPRNILIVKMADPPSHSFAPDRDPARLDTSLSRGKVSRRFPHGQFRFSALKRILYMGAIYLQSIKEVMGEWEMQTRSRQRLAMR
jgi:hypothetical protein